MMMELGENMSDFVEYLVNNAREIGIELNEKEVESYYTYYQLLLYWNKQMNLTAITEQNDVIIKHFIDSIAILKHVYIPNGAKVIDVGTGAGFPGIPLLIVRPDIKLTLLDSLNKRLIFLKEVCERLAVKAEIVHSRAEESGHSDIFREKFNICVSRAVAPMNVLSEYVLPYAKVGGTFIAMKGPGAEEEMQKAQTAVKLLGGELTGIEKFLLPDESERSVIIIKKIEPTPQKYPRLGAKISKKPL
ncbi:MAG: 16S rRNA (guanine(527)-N(7))-methyltransferase RsmG [Bacillota bacterium]|nr:16S rRNA (guanine(527)-N(7))-methyltransferase RsmG [Bacillota bacterium]